MNASAELYTRRPALSYNFLHKSIQELFTAFHISQLPPCEQKEIFHKYSSVKNKVDTGPGYLKDERFKEVWRFVAGLTGFKAIGWEEVKSKRPEELFSYLYEAQDITVCDSMLREVDIFKAKSLFDCYVAGWCIGACECMLKLEFFSMGSGAEVCEAFSSGVKSRQVVRGSVAELRFPNTPIKVECVAHLMELPSSIWQKTSKLDVSKCGLDATAMAKVAEFVQLHMVSLKILEIHGNEVGEGGLVKIFDTLLQHKCLEILAIGDKSIGCSDVEALARLIRPDSRNLKKLMNIGSTEMLKMSPECEKMLMETLLQPSSLESLGISGVDVSSACDCFSLLTDNTNLTRIVGKKIGPALRSMLEALKDNKSVKSLEILLLHRAYVGAVVSMLTVNKFLDTLKVLPHDHGGNKQRCKALCLDVINALQYNKSLKRLEFPASVHCFSIQELFTQTEKDEMGPRVVFE